MMQILLKIKSHTKTKNILIKSAHETVNSWHTVEKLNGAKMCMLISFEAVDRSNHMRAQ